jgi:hypothetical protein
MSNKSCGPDVVKYFIVTPVTPLTGDTYVIGGVNTPATNNTNSALINLIYNQGIPFGTYSLPYTDVYVTGGTFSNDTLTLRRNDGISIPISGFSSSPTTDVYVTGGTFSNGDLILGRNDGISIPISGFFTGSTDTYVTGGTYSNGTLTLNSQDNTITITGFTDYYTTGVTLNSNILEFDRNDTNNAYSVDLSSLKFSGNTSSDCITDIYVSNLNSCSPLHIQNISSGDVLILENGNGFVGIGTSTPTETLDVSGKTKTVRLQVTNGAVNGYVLTSDSFGNTSWSQNVDNYITGGTYSNGTITLNRQNGSIAISGLSTGYTLTSSDINTTLGYIPLSAYTDTYVTGATYSNGTAVFTNNLGDSFNLTGLSTGYTLTSSGISTALGYTPLSAFTDTYVTGITYSNNNIIVGRNQGQSSLTTNISTMTGLTVNGNFVVTGTSRVNTITGTSALFSGSVQNILSVVGSGSTQPLFTVQGSSGELFSVTDSLIGTLFSVNDISGLPILEVFSDNTILMGSYQSPSLNTTLKKTITVGLTTLYSIPLSAYTGGFFDYTLIGPGARSGTIMSIFSGSTVNYSESATSDIGNTSQVTFNMDISGNSANLNVSATTGNWVIKTIVRGI